MVIIILAFQAGRLTPSLVGEQAVSEDFFWRDSPARVSQAPVSVARCLDLALMPLKWGFASALTSGHCWGTCLCSFYG
jgi:hypothetical protein